MPEPRITASVPLVDVPAWAVFERRLFAVLDDAWQIFEERYCAPDGSLVFDGALIDRDGVDDFYEPFFNWPVLHRLGGSADILAAAKKHWEGVTRQLTERGFVHDEFELGYDWFHQGESLVFFYALCAADPADPVFRERAERFAQLYLASSAARNYDAENRMIVAPHTGSGGPRWGVGDIWQEYRADQDGMRVYGLPLHDVDGVSEWSDLAEGDNARRMGAAMQERMGRGDTAINLAATSLVTNAWLYDGRTEYADWVREYVGAWRERAAANGGVLPDNVGPSGRVGELHEGRWFGGHYGWTWPHGLHSVEPAALVAAINESLVTSSLDGLHLARAPLDAVLAESIEADAIATRGSLGVGWAQKLAVPDDRVMLLVPYRHGPAGWFDFHPMPLVHPLWIWWLTGARDDRARLDLLEQKGGYDWTTVRWSHDKEEQGHEAPWFAYLDGRNPDYPETALRLAIAQVARRLALIADDATGPLGDDIHWWQRLNPVVTEVLTQLVTGAPPAVYNGGLQLARVLFGDAVAARPGLPPDVAALVSEIGERHVTVQLVNLAADSARELVLQAGAFAEDRIDEVGFDRLAGGYPGSSRDYDIPQPVVASDTLVPDVATARIRVALPPLSTLTLRLTITRRAFTPRHTDFTAPIKETP
ncbi:hypothetical protein ACEXOS_021565 [Herbiconiux sp. P16]|uniref:hypothetical protein n=1 Tax=Herbiconiux wuyangfengii TaxID=3342794 RepID=UPI0035B91DDB